MKSYLLYFGFFTLLSCLNSSPDFANEGNTLPRQADGTLIADGNDERTYELIQHSGYNHETPDSSGAHASEHFRHIRQVYDKELKKPVFAFIIHVDTDDDRGLPNITDRQRNEIKTDKKSPAHMVGQDGETMLFRWKFRLPEGFRTTTKFTHLHQLKGIDNSSSTADVGAPLITLTAYSGAKGGQQLRVRYDNRKENTVSTLGKADLSDFLGYWVEVEEKVRFGAEGSYELLIRRIKDGKTLIELNLQEVDMWRTDCAGMRPKWGIYRYLGENRSWQHLLRDEEVRFADFSIGKQ